MNRRTFLAFGTMVMLAGCSSLTNARLRRFRDRLVEKGIDILAAAAKECGWEIEYIPHQSVRRGQLVETAIIIELYAQQAPPADENGGHRRLEIIVLDGEKTQAGSLSVSARAARQYRNNETTWEQYISTVLQTARVSGQSDGGLVPSRETTPNESTIPTPPSDPTDSVRRSYSTLTPASHHKCDKRISWSET